jgi:hypothetical protein
MTRHAPTPARAVALMVLFVVAPGVIAQNKEVV